MPLVVGPSGQYLYDIAKVEITIRKLLGGGGGKGFIGPWQMIMELDIVTTGLGGIASSSNLWERVPSSELHVQEERLWLALSTIRSRMAVC